MILINFSFYTISIINIIRALTQALVLKTVNQECFSSIQIKVTLQVYIDVFDSPNSAARGFLSASLWHFRLSIQNQKFLFQIWISLQPCMLTCIT